LGSAEECGVGARVNFVRNDEPECAAELQSGDAVFISRLGFKAP
jgi:hypothetical protein